jgi:hypothetical protein
MLAALLLPVAADIGKKVDGFNKLPEEELKKLHHKYKGLIRWITSKSKAKDLVSKDLLDELEKTNLSKLRDILSLNDEETIIFILIASL